MRCVCVRACICVCMTECHGIQMCHTMSVVLQSLPLRWDVYLAAVQQAPGLVTLATSYLYLPSLGGMLRTLVHIAAGSGDMNPTLHVYTANTLLTKPSPKPNLWFLKNIVQPEADFKANCSGGGRTSTS